MARSASTLDRLQKIKERLGSDKCKAEMSLYVKKDGAWVEIKDLDTERGIQIQKSSKRYAYSRFSLTPLTSQISFSVVNDNGKYSEGSGTAFEGIFDIDTEVQVRGGYVLPGESTPVSASFDITGANDTTFHYHTEYSGGTIRTKQTGTFTETYFNTEFDVYYDAHNYDTVTYTPDGYFIITKDVGEAREIESYNTITVTANTTKGKVLWRIDNASGDVPTAWTDAGALVNGTKTISISSASGEYVSVAILFDGTTWGGGDAVSAIAVSYNTNYEEVYKENFYLDSPSFTEPAAPAIPMIECSGRDVYKKAIESDVTIATQSTKYLHELIKEVCDKIGISYTPNSISDLTVFGARTITDGYDKPVKADDVFSDVMAIINKESNKYRMYVEYSSSEDENILYLLPYPDVYSVETVFNYMEYVGIGEIKKNYDAMLKRITVITDDTPPLSEVLLDTSSTLTGSGTDILSWTGNAEYKRISKTGIGTITITETTPVSITYSYTGASSLVVKAYGSKWQAKISSIEFSGTATQKNDLSVSGKPNSGINKTYVVKITDASSNPNEFQFSTDGGSTYNGVDIAISQDIDDNTKGAKQSLVDGIDIRFSNADGHTLNTTWTFSSLLDPPKYEGEMLNANNILLNRGQTHKEINALIISSQEAKEVSQGFIERNGTPDKEARGIQMPYLNLLLEQNDSAMIYPRYIFIDDIYIIDGMQYNWTINSDSCTFNCTDSGKNFSDLGGFVYDRGDYYARIEPMRYDIGYIYDMERQ